MLLFSEAVMCVLIALLVSFLIGVLLIARIVGFKSFDCLYYIPAIFRSAICLLSKNDKDKELPLFRVIKIRLLRVFSFPEYLYKAGKLVFDEHHKKNGSRRDQVVERHGAKKNDQIAEAMIAIKKNRKRNSDSAA